MSVFVIVRQGDDVLLLRRANTGWKDGCWSLPAGAHDGGETLTQAAARELREETGLVASLDGLRLAHLLHCRTGDDGREWLGAFFIADSWTGSPALGEPGKHDRIGWFCVRDLPDSLIEYTRQGLECAAIGEPFSAFGW